MKIAIHNTFYGGQLAETELSRRLILAAKSLGWDAVEVGSSEAIWHYHPDFVLNLHFKTPKLTAYPTYGCLWHPTVLVETDERFIRNVLSYDAYLSSSPYTDDWIHDRLYNTAKNYFIAPFFTSCNTTTYQQPQLQEPRLIYVGSNWDGERFKDLFLDLEKQHCIDIYGSQVGWSYLSSAYRGGLPFDGLSVLSALNQAGVGLCLHRDEHTQEGLPSMRIFEIVASGAIAICSNHAFIQNHFGNTVLYVDSTLSAIDQAAQIRSHMQWIKTHSKIALEMTEAAHQIFIEKFSLEQLLNSLKSYHQDLIKRKGLTIPDWQSHRLGNRPVELILNLNRGNLNHLQKTLKSVQQQTYKNISILLIKDQNFEQITPSLDHYQSTLSIQLIDNQDTSNNSPFWAGVQAVSGQYLGVLTSGVILYPNHIATLVALLDRFPSLGMAYAEVIQTSQQHQYAVAAANAFDVFDQATLAANQPSEMAEFLPFNHLATSYSFLARSSLIDDLLRQDPKLDALEDLFLLLNLAARGSAMFSYEATCEIDAELLDLAPANSPERLRQERSLRRMQTMMSDREFPTGRGWSTTKSLRLRLQQSKTDLQQAQQRIVAMETSKFWQLRKQWFQLKRKLGLNTNNE
ncbi:MAG: glycosyltransferase family A protein [Leptolyngbyaceae cyanobacterium bins.302]|nr:glycosyltransferase family A protein [Leptolyngbyaceae cyanobacterium bins.302]